MFGTVLRLLVQVLAGVGVAKLADKVAPDKVPTYPTEGVAPQLSAPKIVWFFVTMIAGAMIAKFIGKKFNIKLLK